MCPFQNPEPAEPWTGIYDATKPGNKAMQVNPYTSTTIDGSEDCLYLNIYTPVLPSQSLQKLPVMFFIHGGRLIFGHGNYYTPDYLIKHDVILVTVNYRLNILGWLCLNIPECSGNGGLKDAALALKWVSRNISCFNGDAQNITVSGESAGGAIATSFLMSKMTEGLYSKVIALSGNCISDLFFIEEDPIKKAVKVASILGQDLSKERDLYNFLVQAPVEDLLMAFAQAELDRPPTVLNTYFMPVVEKKFDSVDQFFTEHPKVSVKENRFQKVPILTAANSHEGAIFFQKNGNIIYEKDFYYFIPRYANIQRGNPKVKIIEEKLRNFYVGDKNLDDGAKNEYMEMVSDVFFWRDIIFFPEFISNYWTQTYFLQFNYVGNLNTRVMKSINMKGASHGDMIQYKFYKKTKLDKAKEKDLEIIEMLTESMSNFAKNGFVCFSSFCEILRY